MGPPPPCPNRRGGRAVVDRCRPLEEIKHRRQRSRRARRPGRAAMSRVADIGKREIGPVRHFDRLAGPNMHWADMHPRPVEELSLRVEHEDIGPERHCDEVAAFGGVRSETLYGGCINMEQSAYNTLKPLWSNLPPNIRQHCNEVARFGGSGSYSLLEGCVQMELNARNSEKEFKF